MLDAEDHPSIARNDGAKLLAGVQSKFLKDTLGSAHA